MATIKGTSKADKLSSKTAGTVIYGYGGNDLLTALAPKITIYGGDGKDTIKGSLTAGSAHSRLDLYGGAGADAFSVTISGGEKGSRVFVDGGVGSDKITASSASFGQDEFNLAGLSEVIIEAGSGNDTVKSSASGLYGYAKSTVWGGSGDDTLDVSTESAAVYSGNAVSRVYGGAGDDIIEAATEASADVASLVSEVQGGSGDDTISASVNTGYSTHVDLTISGGAGKDKITTEIPYNSGGEEWITKAYGGNGDDDIRATTRSSSAQTKLYGGDGKDYVRAYGASIATLDGGNDADTLIGGRGDDKLIGGGGADALYGGLGDDTFVYLWASGEQKSARDTIHDFEDDDVLDLSAVDADTTVDGNQSWTLGGPDSEPGRLTLYSQDDGNGYIRGWNGENTLVIDFEDFYAITWQEGENLIL